MQTTGLPVEGVVTELRAALAGRGAAVLTAPPGSGKTTVLPLRLLDEPWLEGRKIVVLEPRRLATRAAARRMAFLLGEEVGETVGYVTRDDRRTGPGTRVEVVTEGVLTRRLQSRPDLADTGLVIFDEFHERNLQTDLGLALTLDVRSAIREDLRVLVMSATIDSKAVAGILDGAPVLTSEAREHPVEIRWMPQPRQRRREEHAAAAVRTALDAEHGDLLVFLPGMGEILGVARLLEGADADIRPLHGSLPLEDQDAAILPSARRRVVLSTDIAETSLTVEGIRVVIDSGLARAPRFDARTGMTRLTTVPISKASAAQRSGRAGRTEPGVVYRLWSKIEQAARKPHIEPEITQVDLAGLALELAAWGADPGRLRFLDPPPPRTYSEARDLLISLGALDKEGHLTDAGRAMADLPLHPRLARMVIADGSWLACLLAALIDERDLLRGPADEIPVDLGLRIQILEGEARHPAANARAVQRVRTVATDLARRSRIPDRRADPERAGPVLALAFPDRLAVRRGSPGRFQLRTGTTAWIPASDPLATGQFLVAADLDGKRKDARIRLAAALSSPEVVDRFAHEVETSTQLTWKGDRLLSRTERRLGGLVLDQTETRPEPGVVTTAAILDRLRANRLADLAWNSPAESLTERVGFLHRRIPEAWPDWSLDTLTATVEEWLGPYLTSATGLDDLAAIDLSRVLRSRLGSRLRELDRLAPTHLELPSGRRVPLDYAGDQVALAVRPQELFGLTSTPQVGGEPVVLRLLSPAGRPVQITSDLAGFWEGSWAEVRKEMAGRYPKHDWPEDPMNARPSRR